MAPSPEHPAASPPSGAPAQSWPPRRILVGYEEAERSQGAWHVALEVARVHMAALWLLHVVELPHEASAWMNDSEKSSLVRTNLERFQTLVKEAADQGVACSLIVELGRPAEKLVAKREELHADLVVLGTMQRGPVLNWLLEEVTSRVVPRTPVPMLLVPSHAPEPQMKG